MAMDKQNEAWALLLLLVACLWTGGAEGQCPTQKKATNSLLLSKIVGGDPAKPGRYPYMASLQTQQSRQHFCGGTLIAKDIVVTAAHCVDNSIANAVTLPHIKIGGVTLDDDPDAEEHETCRTFVHKKFNPFSLSLSPYDIAFIQLKRDSNKTPCNLGSADSGKVTAIGWGLNNRGYVSQTLQEVGLQVLDLDNCRETPGFPPLMDSQMCAAEEGRDACQGDSGGPLLRLGMGCGATDSIVGLVSGGPLCHDDNGRRTFSKLPGVYTKMSSFSDWLTSISTDDYITLDDPTCRKQPPQQMNSRTTEMVSPGPVTVPDLKDEGGCFFAEGIDLGKGIVPMNNGREDVTSTPQECCDLCKNTPGCRAWTYFRVEEKYSPKGACWLRSIVPPASRCAVCTSGLVKPEALNEPEESCKVFLGMDLDGGILWPVPVDSVQECCRRCKFHFRCRAFTYKPSQKICYLKRDIGELKICSDCQSGIRSEKVRETDDVEALLTLIPGVEKTIQNLRQTTIPGPCRLSVGMDLKGEDTLINKGNIPFTHTPEECCTLCRRTEGCRSWTMITTPTKYHSPPGECYMRSDVPEEVPCAACTSGVVEGQGASGINESNCGLLEGVNLEGEDLVSPPPIAASPKQCCNICGETKGCKSWTRIKKNGACHMRSVAVPVITLCSGCDSGIHRGKGMSGVV